MSSCFVWLSNKVRGESRSSWSWRCWSWLAFKWATVNGLLVTAHGLMWLNRFSCGLPWTAKPSFLSFFFRCPPHTRSQTAYSAYSAQLLWGGLFIPPANVHVLLGTSATAKPLFFFLKKTPLVRSTCLPMCVRSPSCVIGLDLWALTGLIITKRLYQLIFR